eukprot:UN01174
MTTKQLRNFERSNGKNEIYNSKDKSCSYWTFGWMWC